MSNIRTDFTSRFNLFYLSFILVWTSLQPILHIDGAGRMQMTLTVMAFVLNYANKHSFKSAIISKPFVFYGLWIVYNLINTYFFKGLHGDFLAYGYLQFTFSIAVPYVALLVTYAECINNSDKTIKTIFYALLVFALLGFYASGIENERLRSEGLGNTYPLMICTLLFVTCWRYVIKNISLSQWLTILILALAFIIFSATRKAFGAALLVIAFTILANMRFKRVSTLILTLCLSIGLYWGYDYAMSQTSMGIRMETGMESNTTDIAALDFLGDRAIQYYTGWFLFLENPITGIGLNNFMQRSFSDYRFHTEYMVQLAECGLIGSVLFLSFYWDIGKSIIQKLQSNKIYIVLLGGFCSILFINLTAWTHTFFHYFIMLGIIIAQTKLSSNESNNLA